jgi:hypothetical protein
MTPSEPPPSGDDPGREQQALEDLRDRIRETQAAAARIAAQMTEAAAGATAAGAGAAAGRGATGAGPQRERPPAAGWAVPGDDAPDPGDQLRPFVALLEALRDLVPPELARQLAELLRELLLLARTLIDWYLDRTERKAAARATVEDIPIA